MARKRVSLANLRVQYNAYNTIAFDIAKPIEERAAAKKQMANLKRRINQRELDSAMASLGLIKVRGPVSGKVYYE